MTSAKIGTLYPSHRRDRRTCTVLEWRQPLRLIRRCGADAVLVLNRDDATEMAYCLIHARETFPLESAKIDDGAESAEVRP